MTSCAYELLTLIYTSRVLRCPDFIPRPRDIRIDPKFSDALDFLLDSGLVTVSWHKNEYRWSVEEMDQSASGQMCEVLTVTEDGLTLINARLHGRLSPQV